MSVVPEMSLVLLSAAESWQVVRTSFAGQRVQIISTHTDEKYESLFSMAKRSQQTKEKLQW